MLISVRQGPQYLNQTISVQGWVTHKRSSGRVRFLVLRDGTGLLQGVLVTERAAPEIIRSFDQLTIESSVRLTGTLRADPRAPGGVEMEIQDLFVFQRALDYPITPKDHGTAFLMEHRHLWLRSSRQQAILKIRHEVSRSIRDFLNDRGFIELAAPILTGAACEGTSTLFETHYFDLGPAYLSQSGQLYMEAGAMAFGKVYCFGPAFRAEKSKTRRHLTEFWMVEPEIAFVQLEELLELVEELVCFLVTRLLSTRREELRQLEREVESLEKICRPFPRLTYQEALNTLREKGRAVAFGEDLGAEDETELSRCYDQPLFIHRYPAACKAFYMKRDPLDDRLVLNMDLLAPEGYGEVVGGSQREEDAGLLSRRMAEHGLSDSDLDWYLDLRRFGSVPHGGFGMGLERMVAWLCGLKHVRETIPFPRTLYRIYP
jgi:asparaginyl-tRNA synthetase